MMVVNNAVLSKVEMIFLMRLHKSYWGNICVVQAEIFQNDECLRLKDCRHWPF